MIKSIAKINRLVDQGFSVQRIANELCLNRRELTDIIDKNNITMKHEAFSDDKIPYIIYLYKKGVAAKQLGIKFNIDKRRIQRWAKQSNCLRTLCESHRVVEFNQNYFDRVESADRAYWLGFFYADAYNSEKTNTISISLQVCDLNHLKKICSAFDYPESKIKFMKNKRGHCYYSLRMYSKHLCEHLRRAGCPQAKSFIVQYPGGLDPSLDSHFIRGVFDGDGCLTYRAKYREWKWTVASTREMCETIQEIIAKKLRLTTAMRNISKTGNNTFELEMAGNRKIKQLMRWMYGDISEDILLDRKREKYLQLIA